MTPSEKLIERYKAAAGSKPPPRLLSVVRRSVAGHPDYQHYPGTESPHLFTYKANTNFTISQADMRVMLRNGFNRIQVNDPGKITLYFADPKADDEEPHDAYPNDMKPRG